MRGSPVLLCDFPAKMDRRASPARGAVRCGAVPIGSRPALAGAAGAAGPAWFSLVQRVQPADRSRICVGSGVIEDSYWGQLSGCCSGPTVGWGGVGYWSGGMARDGAGAVRKFPRRKAEKWRSTGRELPVDRDGSVY
ncbi:hypothetical protein HETIRDRAFT_100861 [Heterobasidion irregulare TC 32-1]|uniref:Uncharacterized protein n=1 Tax=Heterobasidion irregulare (strain TC 32-1) TaxID=747525 RepID=W4KJJ3_HETIT|nr:uncharacterized protein HETIRDRAFT_100861 [Heterobasidion irregulare TC 32-1]ETW85485.1 hypothetical protein HETIRDRAFT_100861 [Heterobasidion irregulare TC 32-1]